MGWFRALEAKVLGRGDYTLAKKYFPEAVNGDARGERMMWIG